MIASRPSRTQSQKIQIKIEKKRVYIGQQIVGSCRQELSNENVRVGNHIQRAILGSCSVGAKLGEKLSLQVVFFVAAVHAPDLLKRSQQSCMLLKETKRLTTREKTPRSFKLASWQTLMVKDQADVSSTKAPFHKRPRAAKLRNQRDLRQPVTRSSREKHRSRADDHTPDIQERAYR